MLGKRLAKARRRAGLSQFQFAIELGDRYEQSMISHVEANRSSLLADGLAKAAKVLNVSSDYLLGLTDDSTPSAQLAEQAKTMAYAGSVAEPRAAYTPTPALRYIEIQELDVAAGGGAMVEEERVIGRLAFRRDWLDRHGLDPNQCSVMSVRGESMEPTLPAGCSILVNRNRRYRRVGRIFVIRTADGVVVKRLGKTPKGWQLLSDHPKWKPVPWPDDAEVIGEVKWMAQTLG